MKVVRSIEDRDPLSQLVRLLAPRPSAFTQLSAGGYWAVRFPGDTGLFFGAATRGCSVVSGSFGTVELRAGDTMVLASPADFRIGSDTTTVPVSGLSAPNGHVPGMTHLGSGPEVSQILLGHYDLDAIEPEVLLRLLPAAGLVRSVDAHAAQVHRLIELLVSEVSEPQLGSRLMVERFGELLLIACLRGVAHNFAHDADLDAFTSTGILRGMADPIVGAAVRAMHDDVAAPWTVAELARQANASRSIVAERFTRVVGSAPMTYLLMWRLALAKEAIARGDSSLTQIAHSLGYSSVSSFSTAFRRQVGKSPGQFAADLRLSTEAEASVGVAVADQSDLSSVRVQRSYLSDYVDDIGRSRNTDGRSQCLPADFGTDDMGEP